MIQILEDLPDNVVGIELTGEITKDQYDQVYPLVEKLANRNNRINYLIKINTELNNITAGVWWDDVKLAVKHLTKWNRIAIVTDQKGIVNLADIFGFAYPGESKTFTLSEYNDAVTWVSA